MRFQYSEVETYFTLLFKDINILYFTIQRQKHTYFTILRQKDALFSQIGLRIVDSQN